MKLIKCIPLSLTIFCLFFGEKQAITQNHLSPQWFIHSMGEEWDQMTHMVSDTAGNLYIVGNFSRKEDDRTNQSGQSQREILIAAYDPEGHKMWGHVITFSGYAYFSSVSITAKSDFYACGYFKGKFALGGDTLIAPGKSALFIAKIDRQGEVSWINQINADFRGRKILVSADMDKKLFVAVTFNGKLETDDFVINAGKSSDILLAVFEDKGKLSDTIHLKGGGDDEVNDLLIHNNHLFLTGSFEEQLIIGDTLISKGRKDAFFVQFNYELKPVLFKQVGNIFDDFGIDVCIDHEENIIFSGSHTDTLVFSKETKLKPYGSLDAFVSKYDQKGELQWADNFGGRAGEMISDVVINSLNEIYVSGNYRGDIEKAGSRIRSKKFSNDVFIAKYQSDGRFRYIESIGDTNSDYGKKLLIDDENYLYLTGNFNKTFDVLGMKPDSASGSEFYITKLYDCERSQLVKLPADTGLCADSYIIIADSGFSEYLWNGTSGSFKHKVDTAGIYELVAYDRHKCLSRDTIVVQLKPLPEVNLGEDLSVQQGETVTLFAGPDFETYLWNTHDTLPILNINTRELIPGEYTFEVLVSDTNCCKNSDQVMLEVIAPDVSDGVRIDAFPNPVKEHLFLVFRNLEPDKKLSLRLYTTNGNLIWSSTQMTTSAGLEKRLNLNHLENGTYYLKAEHAEGIKVLKVVKL